MTADSFLQMHSRISSAGVLDVILARLPMPVPQTGEVLVRIEAAPINPSDLGLLFGAADLATLAEGAHDGGPALTAHVPAARMAAMAGRLDEAMPVGNEGAGTVVAAGPDEAAQALIGKRVALLGGATYAEYRAVKAADCLVLPDDATAADGASSFINPLTALGMVETMRREGHTALVHTAAASNLGQMLNRICLQDGVALVNIVRSPAQAALLREAGARHVVDSSAAGFAADLAAALAETGATLGFDAIGGGTLAGRILAGMEQAANRGAVYSRYGSTVHKQVYIYGGLDTGPTVLERSFGMSWAVGGWLLMPFLARIGADGRQALRARVVAELRTTFASHYSRVISLREALRPDIAAAYGKRATGEKYLIDPSRG